MTVGGDQQEWHEMARHLLQAHGANAHSTEVYAPTLEQLRFEHADTRAALASMGNSSLDQHSRTEELPEGDRDRRTRSYSPFAPSPTWQDDRMVFLAADQTGLPQTVTSPPRDVRAGGSQPGIGT